MLIDWNDIDNRSMIIDYLVNQGTITEDIGKSAKSILQKVQERDKIKEKCVTGGR